MIAAVTETQREQVNMVTTFLTLLAKAETQTPDDAADKPSGKKKASLTLASDTQCK